MVYLIYSDDLNGIQLFQEAKLIFQLPQHANINNIFLNVDVRVTRTDQGVEIFVDNKTEIYDAVIFACHANQVSLIF